MSDLNSANQNYIRTRVEINAINLLLACVRKYAEEDATSGRR